MDAETKAALDYVTLALAVLGAGLGVLNAWRNWIHDRLCIYVDLALVVGLHQTPGITINIRNLSRFDVTITRIGFHSLERGRHMQIWQPILTSGESLPIRLESRASCTVVQPLGALPPERWLEVRSAYAATACGNEAAGGRWFFRKNGIALAHSAAQGGA